MADDLPTEYDVIVLGTGLGESILAAAFARIGQKVLHLDRNESYSGDWASYSFDGLEKWIASHQGEGNQVEESTVSSENLLQEGETLVALQPESNIYSGVQETWYISNAPEDVPGTKISSDLDLENDNTSAQAKEKDTAEPHDDNDGKGVEPMDIPSAVVKEWTIEEVKQLWRKFSIDLTPKLLYCRGPLVDLLISSDIAKYCEFKAVSRVLTWMNEKLEQVPCSRADVFSSKAVSMIDKRVLMKFLTYCLDFERHPEEYEGFEKKTFREYLVSRKMSDNVQGYIIHAIAMVSPDVETLEGLSATKKFLQSLGRYGNTSFLWPLYGSGELPQSFCRMCAVFGGTYHLRLPTEKLILDKDRKAIGVIANGQRLNARWCVMEASYARDQLVPSIRENVRTISRAIYLTTKSILPGEKDEVTLLRFPKAEHSPTSINVIELSPATFACPSGMYLVHMTCMGSGDAKEDFKHVERKLFQPLDGDQDYCDSKKPKVLWSLHFCRQDTNSCDLTCDSVSNLVITTGPDDTLHFEQPVLQAKQIFSQIFPDEEFLPKAPNPEDIIFEGDEGKSADAGFETSENEVSTPNETAAEAGSNEVLQDVCDADATSTQEHVAADGKDGAID